MQPLTVSELEQIDDVESSRVAALPKSLNASLTLDFQQLKRLELVTQQFESRGLVFADAIALVPSNPRFICRSGQQVLMPVHNTLAIELQPMVQRLTLWGRSTQPIALKAWDADGSLMVEQMAALEQLLSTHETQLLPCQMLKLLATGVHRIVLSSTAPFILEGIAL